MAGGNARERARLVLVDATGLDAAAAWAAQAPLEGEFTLVTAERGAPGDSGEVVPIDLHREAAELARSLRAGDHLVGHSYGGVLALLAAAERPDVATLTIIEPPLFQLAGDDPAVRDLLRRARDVWAAGDARSFLAGFSSLVGQPWEPPDPLPAELVPLTSRLMGATAPWDVTLPAAALVDRGLPVLVVSGGWDPAYERVADAVAEAVRGHRVVVQGAGHDAQLVGDAFNDAVRAFARGRARGV